MQSGKLRRQHVYIGGLGRVFTEIYDAFADRAPNRRPDLRLHEALDLRVLEQRHLKNLKPNGELYVVTAGMMSEHTLAHELAVALAPREQHAIYFVGYAAPDTPAGRLRAAPRGTPFAFSETAGQLERHCEMETSISLRTLSARICWHTRLSSNRARLSWATANPRRVIGSRKICAKPFPNW